MKIKEALIWAKKELKHKKIESWMLEAEIILAYIVKDTKEYLYAHPEDELNKKQEAGFRKLIQKRLTGWPTPYLIKHREFFGLNLFVNQKVLIPRQATESIIEYILENYRLDTNSKILEIGTGSGCIIVTLGKLFPVAKITAVDISKSALKIAELNAKNNVVRNIKFRQSNLFNKIKGRFDIIIANLPYLSPAKSKTIKYEPVVALNGGKQGLEIIKRFLFQAPNFLTPKGKIIIEISPTQKNALIKFIKKQLTDYHFNIEIRKDLSIKDRLVIITASQLKLGRPTSPELSPR